MRYLTTVFAVTATLILSTAPANADIGDQLFKLLPDDGGMHDLFGYSVAISGTTAIVGSRYGIDNNDDQTGSAYLFDTLTGQQLAKLLPEDAVEYSQFGYSVAISGNNIIVGARHDDVNGKFSGSAYLYDITDPASPTLTAKLLASDGVQGDAFGDSVAISADIVIVGACGVDGNGSSSGAVYLFDSITGKQLAKLLPEDGEQFDHFGFSVAIYGDITVIGTPYDDDNGEWSGSAYLFNTTNGRQIAKLFPNDAEELDRFGHSVAINNTTVIIGAIDDYNNGLKTGSAYLFDILTGKQLSKLLAEDGAEQDWFGISVAISSHPGKEIAVVGAWWNDGSGNDSGSAYIFDTTTGKQLHKLLPKDGFEGDRFGKSVAIGGTPGEEVVIIGASRNDDSGEDSGSAYIFDASNIVPCPWDLDNSGSVGTSDLLELLSQWGTNGSADFDESGVVGTSDLLILLANWGPCK